MIEFGKIGDQGANMMLLYGGQFLLLDIPASEMLLSDPILKHLTLIGSVVLKMNMWSKHFQIICGIIRVQEERMMLVFGKDLLVAILTRILLKELLLELLEQ